MTLRYATVLTVRLRLNAQSDWSAPTVDAKRRMLTSTQADILEREGLGTLYRPKPVPGARRDGPGALFHALSQRSRPSAQRRSVMNRALKGSLKCPRMAERAVKGSQITATPAL
jgi:hypothetical protein